MIGFPAPELLEDCITVKTLEGWQQYGKQVGYRDDLHWGMLLSLLANVHRGKDDQARTPQEFMPYLEELPPPPEEVAAKVKSNIRAKLKALRNKTIQ